MLGRFRKLFTHDYYKENDMFETLIKGIADAGHMASVSSLMVHAHDVVQRLEDDYFKDGNIKDAAIDTICQILQQHKTQK